MNTPRQMARCILFLVACVTTIVAAQDYQLSWWTVDGGGAMFMTGGSYTLSGTTGQPDASPQTMTGGSFTLSGGFWPGTGPVCTTFAPPDFDHDCDVDAADYTAFAACVSGSAVPRAPACAAKDLDSDGDVDHDDFGRVQRRFSGQAIPANPACSQ